MKIKNTLQYDDIYRRPRDKQTSSHKRYIGNTSFCHGGYVMLNKPRNVYFFSYKN